MKKAVFSKDRRLLVVDGVGYTFTAPVPVNRRQCSGCAFSSPNDRCIFPPGHSSLCSRFRGNWTASGQGETKTVVL